MSNDNYISDNKLDEIRKEYGEKIVSFSNVSVELEKWYNNFGLSYPASSVNNYRDSWFHYRKIWTEHSLHEVTCQMATFDEHLQRAEKDAVVNFFQIISQQLEFWYHIQTKTIPEDFFAGIQQKVELAYANYVSINGTDSMWLDYIWKKYNGNEKERAFALIYAAQTYILDDIAVRRGIQQLLHLIKNVTLKIRLGASDIQRIQYSGEYMNCCVECYKKVKDYFENEQNSNLFYLFGMTNVVKANTDNYDIEQKIGYCRSKCF